MKNILIFTAAALLCIVFLLPLLWMLYASFLPDKDVLYSMQTLDGLKSLFPLDVKNYFDVFRRVPLLNSIIISLLFSAIVAGGGLFINSSCAYAFARLEFPFKNILFSLITALIIIPFEALALPLFLIVGVRMHLVNTLPGLFLPYLAKAFNIFFLRQYFLSLPRELEEASRVEGASWYYIYFHVALPLAKPALAACAVLDFTVHWSEYLWPLIITNKTGFETVQVGLGHFYTLPPVQWGDIMAYSVTATLPMLLIFMFFQKYMVFSLATTEIKS